MFDLEFITNALVHWLFPTSDRACVIVIDVAEYMTPKHRRDLADYLLALNENEAASK